MTVLVRADASAAIGVGHVMRCLALAQALDDLGGGAATFAMHDPPAGIVARLAEEGVGLAELDDPGDAGATAALAARIGARWVVVDGYGFGAPFESVLRDRGLRVLAIDDRASAPGHAADVILDQNLGATAATYQDGPRLLLGPRYALLRREFRVWTPPPRAAPDTARRVLVSLGGGDPENVTALVLDGLALVPTPLEVVVLVGAANPHRTALQARAGELGHAVEVVVDARDMPERMAWADLAVTAAGGTSWELARCGTPQIAIVIADNQAPVAAALSAAGVAVSLGRHVDLSAAGVAAAVRELAADRTRRDAMSAAGGALVDGQGAVRVLRESGIAPAAVLRDARPDDAELVWEINNQETVRSQAVAKHPIPLADHRDWYEAALARPDRIVRIGVDADDGADVGVIRLDLEDGDAIVSVAVREDRTGHGIGPALIDAAVEVARDAGARTVVAEVARGNARSLRAFTRCGFVRVGEGERDGVRLLRLERPT